MTCQNMRDLYLNFGNLMTFSNSQDSNFIGIYSNNSHISDLLFCVIFISKDALVMCVYKYLQCRLLNGSLNNFLSFSSMR